MAKRARLNPGAIPGEVVAKVLESVPRTSVEQKEGVEERAVALGERVNLMLVAIYGLDIEE
jgi:hypothetical protein